MTRATSRQERAQERRERILDEAAALADAEGWGAVTTRRLADAIGYTQPVLYGHFPGGKTEIMSAVALRGFVDLARRCSEASEKRAGREAIEAVATAYLGFAAARPALYEAMFQLPIDAHFAVADNEAELRAGFDALSRALGEPTDGIVTEVFWGALHGAGQLERAGRMRPEDRSRRISEIGARFAPRP